MIVDKVNKIRVYSRLVDDGYYLCVGWYPDFTTFIATALLKVYGNINITCMGQCQYHKNYRSRSKNIHVVSFKILFLVKITYL